MIPVVKYLLGDHLGSTSLTTDASGAVTSEQRYTAWGEVRTSSGNVLSRYTYTGQYSYTSDFGLMFYNARWYDNSLGRFAQADTIVAGGVQGYDRYAYAGNSPIVYNDPDGHCGVLCIIPITGVVLYAAFSMYATAQVDNANPVGNNASNIWELMKLGVNHADRANITGEGLQSLKDDPSVQGAERNIVAQIGNDPRYGNQAYTIPTNDKYHDDFTADGPSGNWATAFRTENPAFLMVHTAELYAANTKVSEDGTISITWEARDQFDYIPDLLNTGGRSFGSYLAYNAGALAVAPIYYGMLHAKPQVSTTATWNQTIGPSNSCLRCR